MKLPNKAKAAGIAVAIGTATLAFLLRVEPATDKPHVAASAQQTGPGALEHERRALEDNLKKKPGHPPILLRLAEIARGGGNPQEAVRHLRDLVAAEPGNTEAWLELGRALYETNDIAGAIEATRKVLETKPGDVDALYNLGAIFGNLNQNGHARKYWTRAVEVSPASESGVKAREGLAQLRK